MWGGAKEGGGAKNSRNGLSPDIHDVRFNDTEVVAHSLRLNFNNGHGVKKVFLKSVLKSLQCSFFFLDVYLHDTKTKKKLYKNATEEQTDVHRVQFIGELHF